MYFISLPHRGDYLSESTWGGDPLGARTNRLGEGWGGHPPIISPTVANSSVQHEA